MEEFDNTHDHLKSYLDKMVDTNVTLKSIGIDSDRFKSEFKELVMDKIHDLAAQGFAEE